jgi:hypothetical protein
MPSDGTMRGAQTRNDRLGYAPLDVETRSQLTVDGHYAACWA